MQRVVDENPPDLKEYGLAQPRIEVAFKAGRPGAHAAHRPEDAAGHRPLRQARRRQEGLPDFVVPRVDLQQAARSTCATRRSLKVDRDKLDALEVSRPATARLGSRSRPASGRLRPRSQARADFSAIEGLVGRLTGLQMKSIVADAEAPTRRSTASTSRPRRSGSGPARRRPRSPSAEPAGEGTVYARDLVAAGGLHGRVGAPRRAEEGPVGVSAEGSVRRARLQRDPARDRARRSDARVREDEGQEQGRARTRRSGGRSRRRRATSTRRRSTRCSRRSRAPAPRASSTPRRQPRRWPPRS